MSDESTPLLEVDELRKYYPIKGGLAGTRRVGDVKALDGVTFRLAAGETLGLVGESGCGKSTVAKSLLRIEPITGGTVRYRGEDVHAMSRRQLSRYRRKVQMVFQDPYTSLDPRMKVGHQIMEPWNVHGDLVPKDERVDRARELLESVGLSDDAFEKYPNQFSGGQRQRIGVARSLTVDPELIVCDEPVSALDVSVQAQVINVLQELQRTRGLAYVFIAHDLHVVRHIAQNVAVMYLGRIVEHGTRDEVFGNPRHPYTSALLSATPASALDEEVARERIVLHGEVPSPANPPSGCAFRTRCWKATELCTEQVPPLVAIGTGGSTVACHHPLDGEGVEHG